MNDLQKIINNIQKLINEQMVTITNNKIGEIFIKEELFKGLEIIKIEGKKRTEYTLRMNGAEFVVDSENGGVIKSDKGIWYIDSIMDAIKEYIKKNPNEDPKIILRGLINDTLDNFSTIAIELNINPNDVL